MSTATATRSQPSSKESALASLEALEAKAAEAANEAGDFRRRHFAAQQHVRDLIDRKRARQHSAPSEYDAGMNPRKGTAAAAIEDELSKVGRIDYSAEIERAERLQRLAEQEIAAHLFEHAEAIAVAMAEQGDVFAGAVNNSLAAITAACQAYQAHRGRYAVLVGRLPGAISGRDVQSDARVDSIALAVADLVDGEIAGPFSASLAPRGDWAKTPPYVLGPDRDGWINAGNAR